MLVELSESAIEKGQIVGIGRNRCQRLAGVDSRRAPNTGIIDLGKRCYSQ
jgi:hypothetical protein